MNSRDNLYRKLKETSPDSPLYCQYKINLRTLNIILKRSIFITKKQYYHTCFKKCKNDMNNKWTILVDILKNKKKSKLPDYFNIDGYMLNDSTLIANEFIN